MLFRLYKNNYLTLIEKFQSEISILAPCPRSPGNLMGSDVRQVSNGTLNDILKCSIEILKDSTDICVCL